MAAVGLGPPGGRSRSRVGSGGGVPALAAAAGSAAAAATAGPRSGCRPGPAADGDRRQQLDGVVVALRAGRGVGRLAHRTGLLEGVSASPASVLVSWHGLIVCRPAPRPLLPRAAGFCCGWLRRAAAGSAAPANPLRGDAAPGTSPPQGDVAAWVHRPTRVPACVPAASRGSRVPRAWAAPRERGAGEGECRFGGSYRAPGRRRFGSSARIRGWNEPLSACPLRPP
jgi:hypothetical protein